MASWTAFYVETQEVNPFVEKLSELTNNLEVIHETEFPTDIGDYYQFDINLTANYLAVGHTQNNWITIVHNSFDKLEDWGAIFSKHFNCKVIVTIAQSTSDAYYFALYDKGEKQREIETCYSSDFEEINFGNKFQFELDITKDEDEIKLFDFDEIELYCEYFGLTIQTDYQKVKWTVLKDKNLKKESFIDHYKKLHKNKPWWKFW